MADEKRTANTNVLDGMRCPECKSLEPFRITATATFKVFDEGTDDHEDVEWGDDDFCHCCSCGFVGVVGDFYLENSEDENSEDEVP